MKGCPAGIFLLAWCFAQTLIFPPSVIAQHASFAQRVYGTWYTYPPGNPAVDSIRYEFRNNSGTGKDEIIVTRICEGNDLAVISRAAAPVEVSEKTIKILKSASGSEKKADGSDCKASIESAVWSYVMSASGDRISITNSSGVHANFQLARQDLATEEVAPSNIYGSWLLPVHVEHGNTVQIKLVLYESADPDMGNIREISHCAQANSSLVSQANSKFKIVQDQITILEAASHLERDGAISCEATITPGTLHYALSPDGETLVLSKPDAPQIVLTREH